MSGYTRKIQVTLTEEQYQAIAALAARDHKAIGVVVREAVEQTCLVGSKQERIRRAASGLLELAKTADVEPPADYHEWEEEYSRLKWAGHGNDE